MARVKISKNGLISKLTVSEVERFGAYVIGCKRGAQSCDIDIFQGVWYYKKLKNELYMQ